MDQYTPTFGEEERIKLAFRASTRVNQDGLFCIFVEYIEFYSCRLELASRHSNRIACYVDNLGRLQK